MIRSVHSSLEKDPYLKDRWYDKLNFTEIEQSIYSEPDLDVSRDPETAGLGYRNSSQKASAKVIIDGNSNDAQAKACCN